MRAAAGATERFDSPARVRRGSSASRNLRTNDSLDSHCQLRSKQIERYVVSAWSGTDDEVGRQAGNERENVAPHDFPESPLQAIALHDRTSVLWNDDADPWVTQKGSENPNLEVFGSSSLPFAKDFLQVRPPGQTKAPGIGSALRRRRTLLAAGR